MGGGGLEESGSRGGEGAHSCNNQGRKYLCDYGWRNSKKSLNAKKMQLNMKRRSRVIAVRAGVRVECSYEKGARALGASLWTGGETLRGFRKRGCSYLYKRRNAEVEGGTGN